VYSDPGVFPKALLLEKWVPPKDVFLPTKTRRNPI
jgi:hypothetical protein